MQPHIEAHLPEALDIFYGKISRVPDVAHFFEDKSRISHAKSRQSDHWKAIAAGKLDDKYFANSNVVGQVHARIGLEPRWYIGGYAILVENLVKGVVHDYVAENFKTAGGPFAKKYGGKEIAVKTDQLGAAIADMVKSVFLDIDVAVSTYFEKTVEEAQKLNSKIGEVLNQAEAGDFTGRVDLTLSDPALAAMASSINNLMTTVDGGIAETGEVLAALADTDLTQRVTGDYKGSFLKLKEDTNAVADKLTEIVTQLRETSGGLKIATGEILAGANDLSERTTRQAATIEETSAAMEQL